MQIEERWVVSSRPSGVLGADGKEQGSDSKGLKAEKRCRSLATQTSGYSSMTRLAVNKYPGC